VLKRMNVLLQLWNVADILISSRADLFGMMMVANTTEKLEDIDDEQKASKSSYAIKDERATMLWSRSKPHETK
jgi:hypothetical protein